MNSLSLACSFLFSIVLTGWAAGLVADKALALATTFTRTQLSVANAAQRGALPHLTAECQLLARSPGGPTSDQKVACLQRLEFSRR
jgi:hypothetical protein